MANKDLVKMALETYKGHQIGQYSTQDTLEVLKNALVEANNGSTTLDIRAIRDGKCGELFALIEEIITKTVIEGLPESSPIFKYVEYRNLKLGDKNTFKIKKPVVFTVADVAEGTQGLRRQRYMPGQTVTIDTQLRGVKIYEELNRVLAGRIDFNEMIEAVSKAFVTDITQQIADEFQGTFAKVVAPYKAGGSWSEATLNTLIDHVEAATGMTAMVIGSKQAVRKITGITGADTTSAKEDLYAMGYYGHIGENPVIAMKNGHKAGSTEFVLNDTDLYVIAADDQFIKFVTEGETLVLPGNPTDNADLSQEFNMFQRYGVGMCASAEFGVYRIGASV